MLPYLLSTVALSGFGFRSSGSTNRVGIGTSYHCSSNLCQGKVSFFAEELRVYFLVHGIPVGWVSWPR